MINKKTNDLTAPDFDGSPFIYWPKLEKVKPPARTYHLKIIST